MLRFAAIVLFVFALSASAQVGDPYYPFPTTAYAVIQRLHEAGIPVCFEQVHWMPSDSIILGDELAKLSAISLWDRTPEQTRQLEALKLLRQKNKLLNDTIIGRREKEFVPSSIDFGAPIEKILDALVAADPDYTWKIVRGRYVVFPRKNSANYAIAGLTAEDVPFHTFYFETIPAQVSGPANLRKIDSLEMLDWAKTQQPRPVTLHLHATDTRFALTAIAEALGPEFVWRIWGENSKPYLEIKPIPPPSEKPKKRNASLDTILQRYEP